MKTIKLILVLFLLTAVWPVFQVNAGSMYTTINNKSLTEGGSNKNYRLKLSSRPSAGKTVTVSWTADSQCKVAHEGRGFVRSGQVVTTGDDLGFFARAVNDADQESTHACKITYLTTSADKNLHNLKTSQVFTIIDNGDAAATIPDIYTAVLGPSSITEGSSSLYSFSLGPTTAPTDKLTITASSNDGQCQLINGGSPAKHVEHTIAGGQQGSAIFTVKALNDSIVEGPHTCTILHSLKTNDTTYSGININNTQVPINDDEASFKSEAVDSEELFKRSEFGKLDAKDANNDGIKDSRQKNLGVFINHISGRRQAIEAEGINSNCNAISTPTTLNEEELKQQSDELYFPHGVISFRVICDKPGAKAQIKLYLDDLYNTTKVNLHKFSSKGGYAKIEDVKVDEFKTQYGVVSLVQYEIADGGSLDEDQTEDGTIHDPVGLSIAFSEPQLPSGVEINNAQDNDSRIDIVLLGLPIIIILSAISIGIGRRYLPKS